MAEAVGVSASRIGRIWADAGLKSQIEALDRIRPGLPIMDSYAAAITHDNKRHITSRRFVALAVKSGKVIGDCMPRRRARQS